MPSEVGSIPTHSRHLISAGEERSVVPDVLPDVWSGWFAQFERVLTRSIVVLCLIAVVAGQGSTAGFAQGAAADSSVVRPDSTAAAAEVDSLRAVTVSDSLGIPGTLEGQTTYDPAEMKEILGRMGSSEVAGRTTWERKKNPRTALICSMVLPGLGQTYNGRRLKVGLMAGFMSYYVGNMILSWHSYQEYDLARSQLDPSTLAYRQTGQLADFYKEEARTYLWWSGACWLIGLLDSWIDAHLYDVRAYTPPPPESSTPQSGGGEVNYLTVGFGLSIK